MTTLAYCAVSTDGQGAPGEIIVRDEAVPGLRRFADVMHEHGAAASIQLGHAGPVAASTGGRGLAPSRVFTPQAMTFTRAITEVDINRITTDFAHAARLAVGAGFDAVELHFGHGYLISSFLSPKLNKRADRWGGSIANRARFARRCRSSCWGASTASRRSTGPWPTVFPSSPWDGPCCASRPYQPLAEGGHERVAMHPL
jgi:2,4-dienoyl-CoA reductase-like NADH-dependent reductase (Old Yellow Enzyme family)